MAPNPTPNHMVAPLSWWFGHSTRAVGRPGKSFSVRVSLRGTCSVTKNCRTLWMDSVGILFENSIVTCFGWSDPKSAPYYSVRKQSTPSSDNWIPVCIDVPKVYIYCVYMYCVYMYIILFARLFILESLMFLCVRSNMLMFHVSICNGLDLFDIRSKHRNTPGLPDSRLCLEDTKGLGRRGWTDWHQNPTAANASKSSESSESGFPTEQLDQIADHVGHLAPICSCYEKCLNHAKARPSPMC